MNTLVKGYLFHTGNVSASTGLRLETLYSVHPDGTVRMSDEHERDNSFNRPQRTWTIVDALPAEVEFIGNYLPHQAGACQTKATS